MRKLALLRAHLIAAVPGLARSPERLITWIDSGSIEFNRSATQPFASPAAYGHGYACPVTIVLMEYSGELDAVMVPLIQWLAHYEPGGPAAAIRFDADLQDDQTWDLSITVTLTERVVAALDCDTGRITLEHRVPEYPVEPCASQTWELYVRPAGVSEPELLTTWTSPAEAPGG